ncbi:protein ENHANCED DISEASE RESISTANCE 2-like isoform X1 [Prunus yedoensis var. nudiflora]|uniref:Protein ENHANCED DISEASE RESISTANCE 2-like isoform X1 n=1 Tax=Prunus yedoensis var. nudiflora TaxID=2094558 RepID=A0A314XWY8_PRUYE|nr:protein ENHANCED DISEASE RESISTANCE 2-like isoform X1 [Prunus yedoensis var. nudiflora]
MLTVSVVVVVAVDVKEGGERTVRGEHDERIAGRGGGGGGGGEDQRGSSTFEYFGWVYHLGVNSIGHEYCHLRFLFIRGKYVEMYKRDPHENPGIKPIRRGVVGPTLMLEEVGRRKVYYGDVYVLRFFNRLDESKKGEIACATAGEAQKWLEAFDQAKQQAEFELTRGGSARNKLNMETELNLDVHRPRVRRYASGLKKLIRIGQGPETLLCQSSSLGANGSTDGYFERDINDAIEAYEWKCVRTINGVRIFEDVANSESGKGVIVKAVAVIDASADTASKWDMLTGDLELLDSYDGHLDVVYGTFDPRYLTRWHSKRDFIFSRQWFCGQDGTYTILHFPAVHKKKPPRSGYRRTKINPSTWEIRNLNTSMGSNTPRCLVTQMLEINSAGWCRWKKNHCSKFEKSVPYALLCQVGGLKEYIGANPALKFESSTTVIQSKLSEVSVSNAEFEESEVKDEFYDAMSADSSSSDEELDNKDSKFELALKRTSAADANKELDSEVAPVMIDPSQFCGSLRNGKDEADTNCWTCPSGTGFMIRGKNYLKDNSKVMGGDPLLKLIAVDWFKVDKSLDRDCTPSTESSSGRSQAGKKLPFVLVINLQVPAKPNYSLALYYASDRPAKPGSLFAQFVDGNDMFRDARFKLIPSIVEGYWMVKRAVGTKACLLGKAVTCKYFRQDNFLEIDVDIGSSSVARSVIGLVLGYVTSIVVDLAILIEAKEEAELPEYILGTVRLNRLKLDSAVRLGV